MGFRTAYPSRIVNNIYFDNVDLSSYQENLSGKSSRTKVRLRWYGDTFDPTEAFLELKIKRNKLGWKIHNKVLFKKKLSQMSWNEIRENIKSQIDNNFQLYFVMTDFPVIINCYERDYFASLDGKIRITLDRNIKFYDQRMTHKINNQFSTNSPNITILEIKSSTEDLDLCSRAMASIEIPQSKSSKYVIGVQSVFGV
jgi:SPX domain protein involved in polyphosphate accumulation